MTELVVPGAYTALVTPFGADGSSVDYEAYEKLLQHQLDGGVTGLVPCGTTGEAPTLTEAEQRELLTRAVRFVNGRARVMAGSGSNDTKKSIEAATRAFDAGVDLVMLVMPYYSKPSQEGLLQHVKAVASASPGPLVLYNIPGRTAVDLSVETLLRILDACPRVVGLKDASGNVFYCQDLLARTEGRISVLSGDDSLTLPMMSVGAVGVISVTSNLYPRAVSELVADALAGRVESARTRQRALWHVNRLMFSEPSPAPVKAALARKGLSRDVVRLPLVSASEACRKALADAMSAFEGQS